MYSDGRPPLHFERPTVAALCELGSSLDIDFTFILRTMKKFEVFFSRRQASSCDSICIFGGGIQPHASTGVGAYTQDYDANGNMVSRANATGTQTLTFDVENRLSQVGGTGGRLLRHRHLRV